jgi:hypothetical protein
MNDSNIKVGKGIFGIIFFIIYIFGGIFHTYLGASSDWTGLAFGMIVFVMLLLFIENYNNFTKIKKNYLKIIFLFFLILIIQYFISSLIFVKMNYYRFILTYISFILIFIVSALFTNVIIIIKDYTLHKIIIFAYKLLVCIGIFSIFLINMHMVQHKEMILFSEPSHFALIYLPLLFYVSYFSKPLLRVFHIVVALIIALTIKDLTLLAGIMLIPILLYKNAKFIIIPLFAALFFLANFIYFKHNYFFERLKFFSHNDYNMSMLVYIYGWQRAYLSLFKSYGFGLGFEQLGFIIPKSFMQITKFNGFGGGSNGAKIIAELGITGIVIIIIYLYCFLSIYYKFVKLKIINRPHAIFFYAIFLMYSIDLFVRGTGYFNPETFMLLASVYWFNLQRNKLNDIILPKKPA